jgi:hypothetical protein
VGTIWVEDTASGAERGDPRESVKPTLGAKELFYKGKLA